MALFNLALTDNSNNCLFDLIKLFKCKQGVKKANPIVGTNFDKYHNGWMVALQAETVALGSQFRCQSTTTGSLIAGQVPDNWVLGVLRIFSNILKQQMCMRGPAKVGWRTEFCNGPVLVWVYLAALWLSVYT